MQEMREINGKLQKNEELARRLADRSTRLSVAISRNQSKAVPLAAEHPEEELEVGIAPLTIWLGVRGVLRDVYV